MTKMQNILLLDQEDVEMICESLKTQICEYDYIKHLCKHPVYVGDLPIDEKIAKLRKLRKELSGDEIG